MRLRLALGLIALAALATANPASAQIVKLGGTHSFDDIRATCSKEGGEFTSSRVGYGCSKNGNAVACDNSGSCTGKTPGREATLDGIFNASKTQQ